VRRKVDLSHDKKPNSVLGDIISAKLAERAKGKSLTAVILSPSRFSRLKKELCAQSDLDPDDVGVPLRVFGVEVKVRPGEIFDIESHYPPDLGGLEWQT
jgi:hypothetical protein